MVAYRIKDTQVNIGSGVTYNTFKDIMRTYGFPTTDFIGQDVLFRRSMTGAARYARDAMKRGVRVKTGFTQRNIRIRSADRKRATRVIVPKLWFILEFGRKPGPGYAGAPPYPFIFPVVYNEQKEMFQGFLKEFEKNLKRYSQGNKRILKLLRN